MNLLRFRRPRLRSLVLGLAVAGLLAAACAAEPSTTIWKIDRTDSIAGQPVEKLGEPRVVATPQGPAVSFAGNPDGLLLSGPSPISGAGQYTVEALVFVESGGPEKQKVIYIQDDKGTRVIIEMTQFPGGLWAFEAGTKAYIDGQPVETYLYTKDRRNATGAWYWLAVTWDGKQMSGYINGQMIRSLPVNTLPLRSACLTGIGVRISKTDSFHGKIREIRLTPAALSPGSLQHTP